MWKHLRKINDWNSFGLSNGRIDILLQKYLTLETSSEQYSTTRTYFIIGKVWYFKCWRLSALPFLTNSRSCWKLYSSYHHETEGLYQTNGIQLSPAYLVGCAWCLRWALLTLWDVHDAYGEPCLPCGMCMMPTVSPAYLVGCAWCLQWALPTLWDVHDAYSEPCLPCGMCMMPTVSPAMMSAKKSRLKL